MKQRLINAHEVLLTDKERKACMFDSGLAYSYQEEKILRAPTVEAIPIEWMKNKRDELEKEYYDFLFYAYTDEGMSKKQVRLLNADFRAFHTVLRYWERENES